MTYFLTGPPTRLWAVREPLPDTEHDNLPQRCLSSRSQPVVRLWHGVPFSFCWPLGTPISWLVAVCPAGQSGSLCACHTIRQAPRGSLNWRSFKLSPVTAHSLSWGAHAVPAGEGELGKVT